MDQIPKSIEVWSKRIAGACIVIGFIFGASEIGFSTFDRVFKVLGVALGSGIVGFFVPFFVSIMIHASFDAASEQKGPFLQGATFVVMLLTFGLLVDVFFAGGVIIVEPVLHFLSDGTVSGTFWDCQNWESSEGHGYCLDSEG